MRSFIVFLANGSKQRFVGTYVERESGALSVKESDGGTKIFHPGTWIDVEDGPLLSQSEVEA